MGAFIPSKYQRAVYINIEKGKGNAVIDECQDLNAAQRNLFLKCLKPNGRFVAVGDPRQAIYGFAGADVESFNLLKRLPHTVKLPLSVCYRCDGDIIGMAKEIVPQIEARAGAPAGVVSRESVMADVKDGDMILCRVSAPLVKLCMQYIGRGVKAYVKGRDIGTNLINMIKKTNRKQIKDVMERLERELSRIIGKVVAKQGCTEAEAKEHEMYKNYEDKLRAIEVLSEGLVTSQEVIDRIDMIFSDDNKNGICLSTIHKSKGLESDREKAKDLEYGAKVNALVVRNDTAVQQYVADKFGKAGHRKTRETFDSARAYGYKDGKNTELHKQVSAGAKSQADGVKLLK